jgi:hypothetical protein
MNTVKLTVEFTFTEDANVTKKDQEVIIENLLDAIRNQINSGMGIAPDTPEIEDGDYITDMVSIRTEEGMGVTYDLKEDQYI